MILEDSAQKPCSVHGCSLFRVMNTYTDSGMANLTTHLFGPLSKLDEQLAQRRRPFHRAATRVWGVLIACTEEYAALARDILTQPSAD